MIPAGIILKEVWWLIGPDGEHLDIELGEDEVGVSQANLTQHFVVFYVQLIQHRQELRKCCQTFACCI